MTEILESSVSPQRIEGRAQQDGRVESRFIGFVQPDHRLVIIAKPHIYQSDIGVDRGILIRPSLQILDDVFGFALPS